MRGGQDCEHEFEMEILESDIRADLPGESLSTVGGRDSIGRGGRAFSYLCMGGVRAQVLDYHDLRL